MRLFFLLTLLWSAGTVWAQNGRIEGTVRDAINGEPVPFANVLIQGSSIGTVSDLDGRFVLDQLTPGLVNLQISFVGYQSKTLFEIDVLGAKTTQLSITLDPSTTALEEVVVKVNPFEKKAESPLSVQSVGAAEIERFPGGNRDISRVIQTLPGVAGTVSYRNDIIVRGGSPNENKFFLDGIEIPAINHFATQGASGGSNGAINVDFIQDVSFASAAIPAERGNALSSLMEFTFKDGRSDRLAGRITLGALEAGASVEGPLRLNNPGADAAPARSTFMASYRRSYQELLFKAFALPFLPTYNDAQFKIKTRFDSRNELTVLGIGTLDHFNLNLKANETPDQQFLLGQLPEIDQTTYTVGARYRRFKDKGNSTFVLSRTEVTDTYEKFAGNDFGNESALLFRQKSDREENKFRYEERMVGRAGSLTFGAGYEFSRYADYSRFATAEGSTQVRDIRLDLHQVNVFAQYSRKLFAERLALSLGLRSDVADYNRYTRNPLETLSPNLGLSLALTPSINLNASAGRAAQLPAYTALAFTDASGSALNRSTLKHIIRDQYVLGLDWVSAINSRLSVEGFFKDYRRYPFLLEDSISLANLGAEFGVVGDAAMDARSRGRAYGLEIALRQKLYRNVFGIVSYTLSYSEFTASDANVYLPSSWDRRHIINVAGGVNLPKNWDLGSRVSVASGYPYSPFDVEASMERSQWDLTGEGVLDYAQLNTLRTATAFQWDLRIDKRWFFEKWGINLYVDVRNVLNTTTTLEPNLSVVRDASGQPIPDPLQPDRYQPEYIPNEDGFVQPSIGLIIDL
jgi:hypothetical protein